MKQVFLCLLFVLLAFAGAFGKPYPCDVRIATQDVDGAVSRGSATLIESNDQGSLALTAHHVIRDAKTIGVVDLQGNVHTAEVIHQCKIRDAAILYVPIKSERYRAIRQEPIGNEKLWVSGWPGRGDQFRSIESRATTAVCDHGQRFFTGQALQGQSGGGIVDTKGGLVGVVSAAGDGETVGLAGVALYKFYQEAVQKCPDGIVCRPPQYGQRIIQVQPQPQIIQRPAPQPKSCDCKGQFAAIIARLSALESREPQQGPPGQDGTDGQDGRDAVIGHETITQIANQAAQIVIKQTPEAKPFYIRVDDDADYLPVQPGQYVTLPLSKAIRAHQ